MVAFHSRHDREPSLAPADDGRVAGLDGVPAAGFDVLDANATARGVDLTVAERANAASHQARGLMARARPGRGGRPSTPPSRGSSRYRALSRGKSQVRHHWDERAS